ncbi:tripartite tricarboxylate transporter substrate binding protein [Sabulicella glaciei]|uniref:Tripartite tricarboxylate transporter substrate binding protein n=1 Tax=Sabulicella glaciei TaxID=2984948 RepID=A0ABT3NYN3_9PROT|nr:tripartite tricarboxylate transporter substrate binding protein [Roseococcus sp. MDT2-1-1]MCW8087241.1 tripartite tricarboxylate transporter substrate binding protein [Roseococcus sp. MDT2-1-1]
MTTRRRALLGALAAAPLATPAFGQARYPNRPIRFLIPWPPGGSLDALHRAMFEVIHKDTGQPVVIENMPGARGTRAAIFLIQQARPDGYTLAHHHLSILRHPYLTRAQTWDPVNDFSYIMQLTGFVFGTVVRADSPFRTWQELIAHAKANPGRLTYSTSGIATTNHIAKEEILAREGARMEHIPMRGAQEGVTALLGRQIDMISDAQAWRPQVENGDFRLLSAWTPTRLGSAPNAPTLRELGYGMSVTSPYGIAGPKGLDPEIVDRLHRLFKKAMEDETSQAIMTRWEMPREYLGPAEYLAFARERVIYEQEMVRRLNLSID